MSRRRRHRKAVQEAFEQFSRLLDDLQRVLGADDPETMASRSNLAS